MEEKNRATRRKKDFSKAVRKKKLASTIYHFTDGHEYYDNLHQYSKNKIHCSCGMCCNKTNNKTKRNVYGNYAASRNPSVKDQRSIDRLNYKEDDFEDDN